MKGCRFLRRRKRIAAPEAIYCTAVGIDGSEATYKRKGETVDRQDQNGDHPDRGKCAFARLLAVRKRALLEGLEISP